MVADLETAYTIARETYNAIICFNYLQRSLFTGIINGLKPGGIVVYETFTVDQARFGRPTNPNFLLRHGELREAFREGLSLRAAARKFNSSTSSIKFWFDKFKRGL